MCRRQSPSIRWIHHGILLLMLGGDRSRCNSHRVKFPQWRFIWIVWLQPIAWLEVEYTRLFLKYWQKLREASDPQTVGLPIDIIDQKRQIMDAIMIENECVDSRQRSDLPGIQCKLYIQKVFDHLNWKYLLDQLSNMVYCARGWSGSNSVLADSIFQFWFSYCFFSSYRG